MGRAWLLLASLTVCSGSPTPRMLEDDWLTNNIPESDRNNKNNAKLEIVVLDSQHIRQDDYAGGFNKDGSPRFPDLVGKRVEGHFFAKAFWTKYTVTDPTELVPGTIHPASVELLDKMLLSVSDTDPRAKSNPFRNNNASEYAEVKRRLLGRSEKAVFTAYSAAAGFFSPGLYSCWCMEDGDDVVEILMYSTRESVPVFFGFSYGDDGHVFRGRTNYPFSMLSPSEAYVHQVRHRNGSHAVSVGYFHEGGAGELPGCYTTVNWHLRKPTCRERIWYRMEQALIWLSPDVDHKLSRITKASYFQPLIKLYDPALGASVGNTVYALKKKSWDAVIPDDKLTFGTRVKVWVIGHMCDILGKFLWAQPARVIDLSTQSRRSAQRKPPHRQ